MFSVVTPVLRAGAALRRCVGSLRGQHGAAHEHIVQDGGADGADTDWLRGAPDVRCFREPDRGMYDAIERGWSRAAGTILSWLNADEQYLPGTLERVAAAFAGDPLLDLVYGDAIVTDATGAPLAARREIPLRRAYVANGFLDVYSCTMFFRRELRERGLLRFDPRLRFAADQDLVLRLLDAGLRSRKLESYLALFGVAGQNLSARDAALVEIDALRARHGGHASAAARRLVRLGRVAERLIAGHYRAVDLEYDWAADERPTYRRVRARGVRGRFDIRRHASHAAAPTQR